MPHDQKPINYKYFREYYEVGCLCVLTNRIKKIKGGDDALALKYYEENCQCTRHIESTNGECWDSLLTPEERKALIKSIKAKEINNV